MFSAIPLPASQGLGSRIVQGMRNTNALTDEQLDTRKKQLLLPYAIPESLAKIASQTTYSNLMGPQFISKLIANEPILANMPEEQKKKVVASLFQSGAGQGTNSIMNQIQSALPSNQPEKPTNSLLDWAKNGLQNIFGGSNQGAQQPQQQAPQAQQAQQQVSSPMTSVMPTSPQPTMQPDISNLPPQEQQATQNMKPGETVTVHPLTQEPIYPEKPTFAEKLGTFKGVANEGAEAGKIRAKNVEELNDTVFNGETNQATLDNISNIVSSPEFEQIRQVPALGNHELSYYAKFGTPAQKNMVGQYYTLSGNILKDSARDFGGQFRKGEQQLLTGMKPNPSDTVDVARGKVESLSLMNKMLTERSRLTSKIMSEHHVDKLHAMEQADKQIDGIEIRNQIHDKLNPVVTIKNKKTGEVMTVPIAEARRKYGVSPNV